LIEAVCDAPSFFLSETRRAFSDSEINFSVLEYDLTWRPNSFEVTNDFKSIHVVGDLQKYLKKD
jgi:hypothetical protein